MFRFTPKGQQADAVPRCASHPTGGRTAVQYVQTRALDFIHSMPPAYGNECSEPDHRGCDCDCDCDCDRCSVALPFSLAAAVTAAFSGYLVGHRHRVAVLDRSIDRVI